MKNFTLFIIFVVFWGVVCAAPLCLRDSNHADFQKSKTDNLSDEKMLNQVITRYLAAIGGEEKLRKIKSKTMRYRVFMAKGGGYLMEHSISRPGMLRQGRPGTDQYFDFDGRKVWRVKGKTRQEIKGPIVNNFKKRADLDGPFIDSAKKQISLAYIGKKRYEFAQLHQVEMVFKDNEKRQYFFDSETGLPLIMKKPSFLMKNNKIVPGPISIFYYFDYRDIQGIKYPHLWIQTDQDQNHMHVFQIDKITLEKDTGV